MDSSSKIYLDHASTSFPKSEAGLNAINHYLRTVGANPGRAGHCLAAESGRIIYGARRAVATLINAEDSRNIVFAPNATWGLNLVLSSFLKPGDRVLVSSMEHNSMMRPLRAIEAKLGLEVVEIPADSQGLLDFDALRELVTDETKLVAINHSSNVVGSIVPLHEVRACIGELPLLVDAAQSAGSLPIDVRRHQIDFLAFTGHKALLGPQGTGGLYIRPGRDQEMDTFICGGTGSRSESHQQPELLPDRFESGTVNAPGIAGLGASIEELLDTGVERLLAHKRQLLQRLEDALSTIDGVKLYGPTNPQERTPVCSFNIRDESPSRVAFALDRQYNILVRAGLHCTPMAHRSIGTFPTGTVRISLGRTSTEEEIDKAAEAIAQVAAKMV